MLEPKKTLKINVVKRFSPHSLLPGLLPLFMLAHFAHHLVTTLLVPLLPLIRDDFALDYTQSGLVLSAFTLSYGVSQLLGGWLADRIGPRILITMGICGVALGGLLVGLSQTYVMMIAFLVLMGLLGGGYHPASPPLVSALVEPKNRGRALGFHLIGGSASFFVGPLIAAAIALAWGWRGSFITLAVPTFVFGIVFYMLLGHRADTRQGQDKIISSHNQTPPTVRRLSHLVPFIILSTFTGAVMLATISFIPLFIVDHFGIGREAAAALIAVIYFAGMWASPLGGHLSDRLGRVPVLLAACFMAGPFIYLLNLVPYGLGFVAILLILGMVLYIPQPTSEAYIVGQISERHRSSILGIYYFSSMGGGGVLTPVIGYLIDHFDFYRTFTFIGAVQVTMTLVCSIFLWGSRD